MSSLDTDHTHHNLDRGDGTQSTSSSSVYNFATTLKNQVPPTKASSVLPLPATTYTPPSANRSKASTLEQNVASVRANGIARDDSPDPHDFYRRPQEDDRVHIGKRGGQGDRRIEHRNGGMIGAGPHSRPSPISTKIGSRYNPTPAESSPLSGIKTNPTLSKPIGKRNTSLKDLVDRFNQTTDGALPLPNRSTSRSPSASPGSHHTVSVRTSSLSNRHGNVSAKIGSPSAQATAIPRAYPRRERTSEDVRTSPKYKRTQRNLRIDDIGSRPFASQSTTNLPDNQTRRPLFGEILAMSPSNPDLGYGIPSNARRRRGSEGSMHSPNPMFPQERGRPEVSPSSPSAWYLGATPTLEEIKTDKTIPELPPNMHRRTRSDFTGAPSGPPTFKIYGTNLSPPRDPPSTSSSANTSKRNSQSRIPISTRRMSATSDSGNSTQSARANSALGRAKFKSPTRIAAPASKHNKPSRSPPQQSRSNTPQKSPRRSDFSSTTQRPATSPRLNAYISAPMPKKSPPLRSSRPRQSVTNASTSASRSRVVDRFSSHDNGSPRNIRERKPYKPPELAGVDFAARREKIQKAVTQTVRENERQDEQRRASMALERQSIAASTMSNGDDLPAHEDAAKAPSELSTESTTEVQHDDCHTSVEENPQMERELTINTGHLSERSVLDLSIEDSPTLGIFNRFSSSPVRPQGKNITPPSDVEPTSAVTAGTSDSVDTFFDDEPQDDSLVSSRHHSYEQQSLMDHIMTTRDSSPSPDNIRRPTTTEGSTSEKDDQESIQIMLGDTPIVENTTAQEQFEERLGEPDPQPSEGPEGLWNMSSWTSSRSRDERDAPMERIDEHSPSLPEQQTHLSTSTSGSQQTPQPWSPSPSSSAHTTRTTMDSDAYSTINRVLDHYHDPSVVSPELMHDFQQQIFTQSPDLARQGGWDPKKVTQLYLQELAKERYRQSNATPDSSTHQIKPRISSTMVPEVPEKEVRDDYDEKMVERMERESEEQTPPATSLEVDEGDVKPARASLNRPDDWNMSPSLGGLELQAESLDSPAGDRPELPLKDWRPGRTEPAVMQDLREGQLRQTSSGSRPELPPIEGLGIAINIMEPQRTDSPIMPPPPIPDHSPPPPPVEHPPPTALRSPPSPSVYSKRVPSSIYPPITSAGDGPIPSLPNNEPYRQSRSVASSIPPSGSSTVSQERPSVDGPSTDATSKNSSPSPDQKRLIKRRHIIKELVDTEHSFGQDMKVVDDIYRGTSNVIIISAEDVKTLFSNSDQIVAFSTSFLDALKQASKSVYVLAKSKRWRSNRISNATSYNSTTDDQSSINGSDLTDDEKDRKTFIGEAFGHHMLQMERVYSDYLKNHDAANQKLQLLQKNLKVQIWLKECRAYACDLTAAWDLDSLLVKPVQRLLKYPLLLDQLVDVTPENHPDFTALDIAAREMKGISMRMNDMKRRVDIMGEVTQPRKRKESDVRIGLSKAFGRRTEKLRQQVGLSDMVEDKAYTAVSEKFGSHFFQLQVVMRDVEMYTNDVQMFMNRFCDFALAMEAHIDVAQSSYPELESRWRKFRQCTREMSMTALTDHIAAVRKNVIEPMNTLLKLHDGPQKLMQKRNKRVVDYARLKTIKDRGDKPDKKTVEQGDQYLAVNETLKDELPKLFAMTAKLVEACLNNFVQLQLQWQVIWRRKLSQAIDDQKAPGRLEDIEDAFTGDWAFFDAQVMSLGICNGSMLNEVANQMNIYSSTSNTLYSDNGSTTRHGSSLELSKRRTLSVSSEQSPVLPQPDFGGRGSGSFFPISDATNLVPSSGLFENNRRMRASSTLSAHSPRTPEVPGSYPSYSSNITPVNTTPGRPSTANPRTVTEPLPSPTRPSTETPSFNRPSQESTRPGRTSGMTYPPVSTTSQARNPSPSSRYSGFFSSAMPMSDSPRTESPGTGQTPTFNVIFLAASVYEFNIDRARKEAGYPYLTYVAGEIFDVIGEKGELWLAKNQDDSDNLVGWIWNKHFVKLAS